MKKKKKRQKPNANVDTSQTANYAALWDKTCIHDIIYFYVLSVFFV